jgi:hypothetical protein
MKIIKIISLILCFALLFTFVCYADEAENWYIVKNGNCIPGFPKNSERIDNNGGIYISNIDVYVTNDYEDKADEILKLTHKKFEIKPHIYVR